MADDLIILTRTLDLLRWLLPRAEDFPKHQRFVLTKRLTDAALDFQETLFLARAHTGNCRRQHLRDADAHLNRLRLYLRLVHEWDYLTAGQYEHVSKMVAEIGRLLGGWVKSQG